MKEVSAFGHDVKDNMIEANMQQSNLGVTHKVEEREHSFKSNGSEF